MCGNFPPLFGKQQFTSLFIKPDRDNILTLVYHNVIFIKIFYMLNYCFVGIFSDIKLLPKFHV